MKPGHARPLSRLLGPALTAAWLSACGSPPIAPETVALRIVADPVITLTQGETLALRIEERTASGFVERSARDFSWTTSDSSIVSASDGVLRAGAGYGQAIVSAQHGSGATADALVWVQPPENVRSTFRIALQFSSGVPEPWRESFSVAARRWEQVIRLELPPIALDPASNPCGLPAEALTGGVETGTRIYVERRPATGIFGTSCVHRPLPRPTAALGTIVLPIQDSVDNASSSFRRETALHEMGHALGLVGTFSYSGVAVPWYDRQTGRYTGPMALEGERRDTGTITDHLRSAGNHWSYPSYRADVMSWYEPIALISPVSVGALMDLGYPAAWYGADR